MRSGHAARITAMRGAPGSGPGTGDAEPRWQHRPDPAPGRGLHRSIRPLTTSPDDAVGTDEDLRRQGVDLVRVEHVGRRRRTSDRVGGERARVGLDVSRRRLLDADADDDQASVQYCSVHVPEDRRLGLAGRAPRCPEVDPDGLAAQVGPAGSGGRRSVRWKLAAVRPRPSARARGCRGARPSVAQKPTRNGGPVGRSVAAGRSDPSGAVSPTSTTAATTTSPTAVS